MMSYLFGSVVNSVFIGRITGAMALLAGLSFIPTSAFCEQHEPVIGFSERVGTRPFRIFDALTHRKKPDLSRYGIESINLIYEGQIWKAHSNRDLLPEETTLSSIAEAAKGHSKEVVIDIERWKVRGKISDLEIQKNIEKYVKVMEYLKLKNNTNLFGYYGLLPIRDYWRSTQNIDHHSYKEWIKENNRLQPVANVVDVLYPSLYTFYRNPDRWEAYAKAQLREARRLAKGKPVYAFLWPQYHDSNRLLKNIYIDEEYWKRQLILVYQYADGVILWGGRSKGKRDTWDENIGWWKATKKFIENIDRISK